MAQRKLRAEEITLITWMIKSTNEGASIISKLENIVVEELNDGGMGSLRVFVGGKDDRVFSKELAKADLLDLDQVPIFISVDLDTEGNFFELDISKGDFSPLKRFPAVPD